eukprot:TRINITY_DN270_c0_g1_i1.p1 TRINITY_DN270_c0_g1~~TRINITY_DN270_c0_g1_i1.p1  ORF type:complete len:104 (+),score=10.39 TRINITY_DN270_c0_g1_i1:56-367(+)
MSKFSGKGWVQFVGLIGAVANWTIPLAAIKSTLSHRHPSILDPKMNATLAVYSCLFMRWSIAIYPPNYPLLACHIVNSVAQSVELGRYLKWRLSGGTTLPKGQ